MEILSLVLLIVWVLGIVVFSIAIPYALNDEDFDPEATEQIRLAFEVNPMGMGALIAVVVVFWPVSLAFNALTKGKK